MTNIQFSRDQIRYVRSSREVAQQVKTADIKDIEITSPQQDNLLKYDATAGKFVNVTLASIQGTITEIDGGTY